jgi:hypothetical protein
MRIHRALSWLLLASAVTACDSRPPDARREPAAAAAAATDSSAGRDASADTFCATPPGGLRVAIDSMAGMPADASIRYLRNRCARVREDEYAIGGSSAAALMIPFRGGRVWAVQSNVEGAMDTTRSIDLWAAEGDSLRMPDGTPVPRTLGELRTRYPAGFVTADKGDDADGVLAFACLFPRLVLGLSWEIETPADTGHWALARKAVGDTASIVKVEVWPAAWAEPHTELCTAEPSPASGR